MNLRLALFLVPLLFTICAQSQFITSWTVDAGDLSITIPTYPGSTYDYDVDWGDGNTSLNQTGDATHTYAGAGTYSVSITGSFPAIHFNNGGDKDKIVSIDQWGDQIWERMDGAFWGCSNLTYTATDTPDLSNVSSLSTVFRDATLFNGDIGDWDVSSVGDMSSIFHNATSFNQDIGNWDVSSVSNMGSLFFKAASFNQDLSSWDVKNVTNMSGLFDGASSFNHSLSAWDISSVVNMHGMFNNATFFNQDLSGWDVSLVIDISFMFSGAESFNQDIGGWNVSNKSDLTALFQGAKAFDQDLSSWDVSNVTNMGGMFNTASSFNQDISGWDVSNVTNMFGMFVNAEQFNQDVSGWDVGQVTSMFAMFFEAFVFNQDISGWNVANVTQMNFMFSGAGAFDQDLSAWDIGKVASMPEMLDNSGLSIANYDATLNGWASQTVNSNVTLGAAGLKYTAESSHNTLVSTYNWTIVGDQLVDISPTGLTLDISTIDENYSTGSLVGMFSTSAVDEGGQYSYTLVTGTGDEDNGSFMISGAELQSGEVFDFEAKASYNIRVQTDDNNGGTYEGSFTITINDAIDAPTDIELMAAAIDENSAIGTVIDTFTTTDQDAGETHTYTLVTGTGDNDNSSFMINGDELQSGEVFDFEAKASYNIRVQTDDNNGGTYEESFAITINDAIDAPTDIELIAAAIDENSAIGTVIDTFTTTDQDADETHTYTLVTGTGDEDNGSFMISGDELQSGEVFDFETRSSYTIRVQTDDNNGGTYEESFTITINDAIDAPTDIELIAAAIDENSAIGTVIDTFTTTDQDADETHTYTLVAGTGDEDNGSFMINGDELQSGEVFDFETKASYNIRVQTDDNNGGTYEESFTITINDAIDAPTDIELIAAAIDENSAIGTVIDTFTTTDQDAGETHTYTLVTGTGDEDNGSFMISGAELQSGEVFDFEAKASYNIRVQTDDNNGGTYEGSFTITINDAIDAPTDIELIAAAIDENSAIGTVIDAFSTTDQDAGETHSYTLVAGTGDEDNGSFMINGDELQSGEVFDFETKDSYTIRVQTDDNNGGTYQESFTITINDAIDAPTDIELIAAAIDENSAIGTVIDTFTTTDQDAGETHTYTLVTGTGDDDNGSFMINGDELKSGEVFDFETKSSYTIRVQTNGQNGGTYEESFTITINDLEETVTSVDDSFARSIEIHPNPVSNYLTISKGNFEPDSYTIELITLQGKILVTETLEEESTSIDVSRMAAGIYQLRLTSGDEVLTTKVIVK